MGMRCFRWETHLEPIGLRGTVYVYGKFRSQMIKGLENNESCKEVKMLLLGNQFICLVCVKVTGWEINVQLYKYFQE